MVGGVTYDEAWTIHEYNALNTGVRITLGGTTIHNSQSFLKDVANLAH
jgi:vacuolar protein sorting-associated protein 45